MVIVVPCYNEELRLDSLSFRQFAAANRDSHFMFVDDGSTDGTNELLRQIADHDRLAMSVLTLEANSGKAEAVRRGILAANELGPEYIGFLDADLSTPLAAMSQCADVLRRCRQIQIVLGSRRPLYGREIDRDPLRHVIGRVFASVAAGAFGVHVYDTQCGAKMFRSGQLLNDLFSRPFESRWIFDVEILARLRASLGNDAVSNLRRVIYELPLDQWRERAGSKLAARDYVRAVHELTSLFVRYRLYRQPELADEPKPAEIQSTAIPETISETIPKVQANSDAPYVRHIIPFSEADQKASPKVKPSTEPNAQPNAQPNSNRNRRRAA